jgi:hypothetical protein
VQPARRNCGRIRRRQKLGHVAVQQPVLVLNEGLIFRLGDGFNACDGHIR